MNTLAIQTPSLPPPVRRFVAFVGHRFLGSGTLSEVVRKAKPAADRPDRGQILVFDQETSETVEIDFRGTMDQVLERASQDPELQRSARGTDPGIRRGPGRPKLGVVGREVTLLPRHWEWLDDQPGGASVALRRLVEEAKRTSGGRDRARRSQEAVYRFLSVMGGDLPGYEEAARALYADQHERLLDLVAAWPPDIRRHLAALVESARRHVPVMNGE